MSIVCVGDRVRGGGVVDGWDKSHSCGMWLCEVSWCEVWWCEGW